MAIRSNHEDSGGLAVAATVLVGALLLAGCSAGANANAPGPSGSSWATSNPANAKGSITFWAWGDNQDVANTEVAAFNKTYPNVKVNFRVITYSDYAKSLSAALASGKGPDVYNLEPLMASQFGPLSEDLTPLIAHVVGKNWKDTVSKPAVAEMTNSGKLVGAPNSLTGGGTIIVNTGLLEALGLKWPTNITSVDGLSAFCKQVLAKGKGCIGIGAKDEWVSQDVFQSIADSIKPGVYSDAVAGKVSWTDQTLVRALDIWKSLFTDGVFQAGALGMPMYPDTDAMWQKGDVVASALGTWSAMNFVKDSSIQNQTGAGVSKPTAIKSFVTSFPAVGGNEVKIFASVGSGTALNQTSKNKEAAAAWINWYSISPSGQQKDSADTLVGIPPIPNVKIEPKGLAYPDFANPSIEFISKGVAAASETRSIPYPDLVTALGNALQKMASGSDSKTVAKQLDKDSKAVSR